MKAKNYLIPFLLCLFTAATTFAFVNENVENQSFEAQEPYSTIIESLQNGESYSIEITSVGCFNGTRQTVIVSREGNLLTASFQGFSKILTETDIEAFRTFELQLQALQIGGCSTVDTYVLRYGNDTFQSSDGTCSWNGGKKLLKAIS